MRIGALPPQLTQTLLASLPAAKAAAAFARDVEAQAMPLAAPPMQSAPPPATVQLLVAIAASEPAVERRRKLAAEADRGLRGLERLHAELLAGAPSPERLTEIAEWAASSEAPNAPALAELFRDIELRVKVELAKHELHA